MFALQNLVNTKTKLLQKHSFCNKYVFVITNFCTKRIEIQKNFNKAKTKNNFKR